jgi:hypothetical protein
VSACRHPWKTPQGETKRRQTLEVKAEACLADVMVRIAPQDAHGSYHPASKQNAKVS